MKLLLRAFHASILPTKAGGTPARARQTRHPTVVSETNESRMIGLDDT